MVDSRITVVGENGKPEHSAAPWHVVRTGDFNKDGKADLLWVNEADRTMQLWVIDSGRVVERVTVVAENGKPEHSAAPWHIIGTGDATGNAKAEILWLNEVDGTMQLWAMNSGRVAGRVTVVAENGKPEHSAAPWHIVGKGDFTGDGDADILWLNGNVTGSGKADILWLNDADGTMQLWVVNGGRVASRVTVVAENGKPEHSAAPWRIVRTGGDASLRAP